MNTSVVNSHERLPKYLKTGNTICIRLDETETTSEDFGSVFSYVQAKVKVGGKLLREQIIEAIVRAKYPTYGAELAAQFNGGEDLAQHQDWRQVAKTEADYFIENYFSITQC